MPDSALHAAAIHLITQLSTSGSGSSAAVEADDPRLREAARLAAASAEVTGAIGASPQLHAAAVAHNFVYQGLVHTETLADLYGLRTAWLVEESLRQLSERSDTPARGKARARQRVRYFMAAYRDPELGLLGVATLWGRFRLAQSAAVAQRRQFVEEGRQVLIPLLEMLGMRGLREEVEAWLWRLDEPYASQVAQACDRLFAHVAEQVQHAIPAARLTRRPCPPTQSRQAATEQFSGGRGGARPVPAIDVSLLVESEEECYRALYPLHRLFTPVDGGVIDDLGSGRINGARSLQTTVSVPIEQQRARVTFHICTPEMEEVNHWGLAAVVARGRYAKPLPNAWWNNAAEGAAQIASAPLGSLPETLYVFSPQGQLFRFHRGCTVVDYAYHVHTEVADRCQRFYINGEVVEPTTPLHHLDLVTLEVDPRAPGPTQIWLNAAQTSRARNSIERFLKRRGLGVDQGQRILDQRRRALEAHYGFNLPDHRISQATAEAMRQFKFSRVEELLAEVAAGRIVADRILHPLFAEEISRQVYLPRSLGVRAHLLQLAQCCKPKPGDDIVGLPSRRQGEITRLRIHRAGCTRVFPEDERLPLKWRFQPRLQTIAQIELTAHDEDGLLGDALAVIYAQRPRATVHRAEAAANHGTARLRFTVEAESGDVMERIVTGLRELPGRTVVEVQQLRLPPSELEAAMHLGHAGSINPYSRLPVNEQAMFFGRSQELLQIYEWLRDGVGNIWLLGQKRVGKTSLLLHLKNYYLKDRGLVPAFVDFQLFGEPGAANLFYEVANSIYSELQTDPRIVDLGAPLPAVFADQPAQQLIHYLRGIRTRLGASRLVLLLDEFSTTTAAYLRGDLARGFFDQWRGLIQAVAPDVSFVTVFQQQTYNALSAHAQDEPDDPGWNLLELGERLILKSLSAQDVRRLIQWPMRNFMEYTPESVEQVVALTGGNPFLTQAFCSKLTAHMARADRRLVEPRDVEAVRLAFMEPSESVFAHFLEMARGGGFHVTVQLARLATGGQAVTWDALVAALPHHPPDKLRRTLAALGESDLLCQPEPGVWRFTSLIFQQWLELNMV